MANLSELTAISPIDGRYRNRVAHLAPILSEYGLIEARVKVELAWILHLADTPQFTALPAFDVETKHYLNTLMQDFNVDAAKTIKTLEQTTNHDVKAVEYYIKKLFAKHPKLVNYQEFIHFACTSEDINNVAYSLMIARVRDEYLLPRLADIIDALIENAHEYADVAMLSRTHGQSATPTTVGKEFANFAHRLIRQRKQLADMPISAKFNGAVGNYNAHIIAFPEVNWLDCTQQFVTQLGLTFSAYTAQIEPHDGIAEFAHILIRCNQILRDFCRDMWGYISLGYFKQKTIAGEIGSSTMPHKVNPIDFENAEGNIGMANAILDFMALQLTNSRWQRDLVDSTVLRNLGVAIAHSDLAWQMLSKGLAKCQCETAMIESDLNMHWEVLAEAVQTVMRRYSMETPYEALKDLTRGKRLTPEAYAAFVGALDLPEVAKTELMQLTPHTYTGIASQLAKSIDKEIK